MVAAAATQAAAALALVADRLTARVAAIAVDVALGAAASTFGHRRVAPELASTRSERRTAHTLSSASAGGDLRTLVGAARIHTRGGRLRSRAACERDEREAEREREGPREIEVG